MPRVPGAFLQLVAGATHAFLFALQLRGAQRQQRGGDRKDGGWQQRSGGEHAATKVRDKRADKHGANRQRGPDAFTAHASRDVIEGKGCERHKWRHEDGSDDVSVARGLARAMGVFFSCDFRREVAITPRQNATTRRASTARPMAAAIQHASTIDLSKSLFIRVLYAMLRAGEAPPGATVTFLPRGKAASIARASGGFASAPSYS